MTKPSSLTRCVLLICGSILVSVGSPLALCQSSFSASAPAPLLEGIDCGCDATGDYVDPHKGFAIKVNPDSTSPGGKYRVKPSGSGPYTVEVRKTSDNSLVFSTVVPGGFCNGPRAPRPP